MEIGVNKGHYLPEETTYEGPTWVNVGACVLLKLIINKWHDSIETGHVHKYERSIDNIRY